MIRFKRWLEGGAVAQISWALVVGGAMLMVVSPNAHGLQGPGLGHFFSDRACGAGWTGNKMRRMPVTGDIHAIRVAESIGALSVAIHDTPIRELPYWCAVRKFDWGMEDTVVRMLCGLLLGKSPNALYCHWEVQWISSFS